MTETINDGEVMKITLTDEEVRQALAEKLAEKVQHVLGKFDPEECWFNVVAAGREIDDVEEITFTGVA